jgi:hypothetical protein
MKLNSKVYLSIMCMLLCYFSCSTSKIKTQDIKFLLSDPKLNCKFKFDKIDTKSSLFTITGSCKGGAFSNKNLSDCIANNSGTFGYGSGFMNTCKNCNLTGNTMETYLLTCSCKKSLSDSKFSSVAKAKPLTFIVWNYTKGILECRKPY